MGCLVYLIGDSVISPLDNACHITFTGCEGNAVENRYRCRSRRYDLGVMGEEGQEFH